MRKFCFLFFLLLIVACCTIDCIEMPSKCRQQQKTSAFADGVFECRFFSYASPASDAELLATKRFELKKGSTYVAGTFQIKTKNFETNIRPRFIHCIDLYTRIHGIYHQQCRNANTNSPKNSSSFQKYSPMRH